MQRSNETSECGEPRDISPFPALSSRHSWTNSNGSPPHETTQFCSSSLLKVLNEIHPLYQSRSLENPLCCHKNHPVQDHFRNQQICVSLKVCLRQDSFAIMCTDCHLELQTNRSSQCRAQIWLVKIDLPRYSAHAETQERTYDLSSPAPTMQSNLCFLGTKTCTDVHKPRGGRA